VRSLRFRETKSYFKRDNLFSALTHKRETFAQWWCTKKSSTSNFTVLYIYFYLSWYAILDHSFLRFCVFSPLYSIPVIMYGIYCGI